MNAGVYGDVSRVKIMFNKKDTALVQFADPGQAQIGQQRQLLVSLTRSCNQTTRMSPVFFSVLLLKLVGF